ncbi:M56 family metallopeptidase [Sphingomonas beigongshangi]|uniref:M56 family metallopeptidase n=1 Tax=Sphingomonas beigongshangi TaxID=2782540 RepID=UPI0031F54F0A
MTAPAIAAWAVEALIASTLLMLLVFALRRQVRRTFGPQVAYALWALPVLRLVLPPLPTAFHRAVTTPISHAGETISVLIVDPDAAAAPVAAARGVDWPSLGLILGLIWAVGAGAFLAWHLTRHARFCRRMVATAAAVEHMHGVRVITSAAAPGPLAFGIVRRYVAFPLDFADRYDSDERALALEHEIGHHQRGDLAANWIALAVLALHWFNPVAWRAFRAFRADQELANDARVLAGRSAIDRHTYACAIVKAAHGGAVSAACHLHTIDDLKGRIRMLSTSPRSRRRIAAGGTIVSMLALVGLGLTASGTSAAAAITGKVGAAVGVDLQAVPPVPPAPPAPPAPLAAAVPPEAPAAPRHVIVQRVARDGQVHVVGDGVGGSGFSQAQIDAMVARAMANAPQVTQRTCVDGADGGPRQFVINTQKAGKRVMIVCANRIQAASRSGAETAARSGEIRRSALSSALASVEASRATIRDNRDMPESERAEALAEMDSAIAELRQEMASPDKDD